MNKDKIQYPKCSYCDNISEWFCIVNVDVFSCDKHVPNPGGEYFWKFGGED